jgi:hypothetical protein
MPDCGAVAPRVKGNAKLLAKKRALSARALVDLDRWIAGREVTGDPRV